MPPEVLEVTEECMADPIRTLVKRDESPLEGVKQFFVAVEREEWKFDTFVTCDTLPSRRPNLLQHKAGWLSPFWPLRVCAPPFRWTG